MDTLFEIFHPYAAMKTEEAMKPTFRFAYYTRAETAYSIIKNEEIWLRKTTCMNDYREVEFGISCLEIAREVLSSEIEGALGALYPNIVSDTLDEVLSNAWNFVNFTYIACFSEHKPSENNIGRLSMWRAYGGQSGVAVVLKPGPLALDHRVLGAWASPVVYCTPEEFIAHFQRFLASLRRGLPHISKLPPFELKQHLSFAFKAAILTTKHIGFSEELEWRIVHNSADQHPGTLVRGSAVISGAPQLIMKLPLKENLMKGISGLGIPSIVDHVILGPMQYPDVVAEAMFVALQEKGVTDLNGKVRRSDIPLRVD